MTDYLQWAFTDLDAAPPVNRREFFKRMAGGIVIFIVLGDLLSPQEPGRRRGFPQQGSSDFNAFLRIDEDGQVTCFTGKVEMGQGVLTSLPQMLADELDTPVESIHMIMGDTDLCPWDMGTFGSMSTRFFGPSLRRPCVLEGLSVTFLEAAQFLLAGIAIDCGPGLESPP